MVTIDNFVEPNVENEEQEKLDLEDGCLRRCMEMTIANEKREDAIIIILWGTRIYGIEDYSFRAKNLHLDMDVYSSPIFSILANLLVALHTWVL